MKCSSCRSPGPAPEWRLARTVVVWPLLVVMNDERHLRAYTNGWITNIAVIAIVALAFVLAVVAIPLQILGG